MVPNRAMQHIYSSLQTLHSILLIVPSRLNPNLSYIWRVTKDLAFADLCHDSCSISQAESHLNLVIHGFFFHEWSVNINPWTFTFLKSGVQDNIDLMYVWWIVLLTSLRPMPWKFSFSALIKRISFLTIFTVRFFPIFNYYAIFLRLIFLCLTTSNILSTSFIPISISVLVLQPDGWCLLGSFEKSAKCQYKFS